MYKIINDYQIRKGNSFIPRDPDNTDYQQFVEDIYTNGLGIVEGADIQTTLPYADARMMEYPPIVDQLDKIYHEGIDAWKADIKVIKDKYPKTQVGITSIAPIPDWVDTALFEKQKEKYVEAVARLAQYELSAGVKNEDGTSSIKPLPISINDPNTSGSMRNPLVVQDEAARAAAQTVINKTPQAVIDSINT